MLSHETSIVLRFAAPCGVRLGAFEKLTRRFGTQRALLSVLLLAVVVCVGGSALPASRPLVVVLSVFTPLAGALLIAQFWVLAGRGSTSVDAFEAKPL